MTTAFAHGLLVFGGLLFPLNPQDLYILQTGARERGRSNALTAAMVAAASDTVLILAAGYGVSMAAMAAVADG